uniref:Uncharacterized protein n=1 Tax=Kalanchoe fedtschenkoi TaxID=63787 RepID=A0A7N0T7K8_KALFE
MEMKTIRFLDHFISFRTIRTRTVDLFGKTDQTCYYQNDSNCFKNLTCSFLHWAHYASGTCIKKQHINFCLPYFSTNSDSASNIYQ